MVAVAVQQPTNGARAVTLAAGEEASGLAQIMGQYLDQLLEDSSEKRAEAATLEGRLGLLAREGNVAVTVRFGRDGIVIEEGLHAVDGLVSGEVEYLLHVLAGRVNPAWAIREGRVALRPGLRRPLLPYRSYLLMRLPGVHLWSGIPRQPARYAVGLAAVAAVGAAALLWHSRRARAGA
jgi:hypothetical protein